MLKVLVWLLLRQVQGEFNDIATLLQESSAFTEPVKPTNFNTTLNSVVEDLASFSALPPNLQRAMLWSAGWVRAIPESAASDTSAQYVQVYVQCGLTMSNIFLSNATFDNETLCSIKRCKSDVIAFAMSTCEPSFVEPETLCALSPEADSYDGILQAKDGPIWSIDGQIDESFDPELFQAKSSDDNSPVYMLAQKGSWAMDDDTCPNGAQFIVPCRKVAASEIKGSWCEPAIEPWVTKWIQDETNNTVILTPSSPTTEGSTSGKGLSVPAVTGIILTCIVLIFAAVGFVVIRQRASRVSRGHGGLWEDDVIIANRIPREKVRVLKLISRGAFGEVYGGIYNDQQVAVKMLLQSTRRDIKLVNEFLREAKLTAMMEHPRIVTFIGIAWDSLSDVCVVLEFMDGGDLRTLLSNYEQDHHPIGFDREKVTIALHVCHALTYLHSLEPPVIHRDLKSRNILLNEMLEAKLTDFGISRERLDRTMTAGVGTSLWMAPEVMMGEKYDVKADMFSFGVVLSELDFHTLPYTLAKEEMQNSHGRQMTDATLLQKVAMGTVRVEFSDAGLKSMVDLGYACVAVDPTMRPSAAEALFKLQVIFDVVAQLYDNTAITEPPTPASLNSALTDLVGTVANFSSFPANLQRAMLWSAGWVQAIPASGEGLNTTAQYVQVYVKCGRTMTDVFLSSQDFDDSSSCEIKKCKSDVIAFTMSTCESSYVEKRTACAVSSESWNVTLKKTNGPMWSVDGQIDESFDPQLLQLNDNSDGNTTLYLLTQKSSWTMDDDTCPNGAQFIVPCRQVSVEDVDENTQERTWCEPELELSVKNWLNDGTLAITKSSGGLNASSIVGISAACVVVVMVAILVGIMIVRRHHYRDNQGQSGLWDDDNITANRIPREKVRVLKLISRGAFGEVYAGIYNDQQVAVKMLLQSTRRDIKLVNEFLREAKLTAMMEHPRIVTFIGIAWDSLSDVCVVLEFMDGGDLRTLLSNYEQDHHPIGFDREKVTIALHVCHALTYLHSLEPPVIHRDLKSRNILLNEMLEAKLTDFGISRERLDRTMTAGVGTSLWMAPEVMMGEKYDVKADMFSFGVVLSELDLHTLPYTQAKEEMQNSHGRQMTDATLLQKVAMGTVKVEFSDTNLKSMADLGYACVAVDPTMRPSAAEALFKLQVILSKEL
ncbi:TKL protein kinase [Phytophthora palmivora]|uniref:TKL protein kinase n=1 Tax=Phytophthora palmivora TaxID=4796 RepID=A0A2P4XTQ7_9STRA|nr:TKL protein kinase [Phytophthora palmivora]